MPMPSFGLETVANGPSAQIKEIVQNLYELMVQASAYDNVGPGIRSRDVLQNTMFVFLFSIPCPFTL
jgi:hypothetical protein